MSDYQDAWLERIEHKLDSIQTSVAGIEPLKNQLESHIQDDARLFHGNGQPGLIKDVECLKQDHKKMVEDRKQLVKLGVILLLAASAVGGSVPELVKTVVSVFVK